MRSLKARFAAAFVSTAFLSSTAAGIVLWTTNAQRSDGAVINLAGAQRMLSQRMTKEALLIRHGGRDVATLRKSIGRFDRVLRGLSAGDPDLGLPVNDDAEVLVLLTTARQTWQPLRESLARVADSTATNENWTTIEAQNTVLLTDMDSLVKLLERRNAVKVQRMFAVQTIALALILLILMMSWVWLVAPVVKHLCHSIDMLRQGAEQVATSAGMLSSASNSLAEGASTQAAAIAETSASTNEIDSMGHRNSEHAKEASTLAHNASCQSEVALGALDKTVDAVVEIRDSSDRIARVMKVVDEVAFQTSILALNAAVEAAHAGEAGLGFAIVADEVRNLAQRCAHAAQETQSLIEAAIGRAHEGTDRMGALVQSVQSLANDSKKVNRLVDSMCAENLKQVEGLDTVSATIAQLESVTQSNAAGAQQVAASAEQLTAQSESLREVANELSVLVGRSRS